MKIINPFISPYLRPQNWLKELRARGFDFPDTYVVFDLETTGLDTVRDNALQIGHLCVENGNITHARGVSLDWTRCKQINQEQLRERIATTGELQRNNGKSYRFTYEGMRGHVNPYDALEHYRRFFKELQDRNVPFLTHNGFKFDSVMLESHFRKYIAADFRFNKDRIIDTGLFEKAIQGGDPRVHPEPNESMSSFYHSVSEAQSHDKWSLDGHCLDEYKLVEKYGLDRAFAHTADFDCLATHCLYQEYRRLALAENKADEHD